jgi:hypothetical protein
MSWPKAINSDKARNKSRVALITCDIAFVDFDYKFEVKFPKILPTTSRTAPAAGKNIRTR